jgi:hypothetical protein
VVVCAAGFCFCVAVLGSTLLPAAGPVVLPWPWDDVLPCAMAAGAKASKAVTAIPAMQV